MTRVRMPLGALLAFLQLLVLSLQGQQIPVDVGTTVAGFQDDFNGAALQAGWVVRGQSVYAVSGGMLHVTSAAADPNHLLYEIAGYDSTVQEILARIRINTFGSGDPSRAGVAIGVTSASSQGLNFFFRDEPAAGQRHMEFLDDTRSWGPEFATPWQNGTWYWLRLRQEPDAAAQGGAYDVFGKIWAADGVAVEPSAWQLSWDYIPTRSARTGFAGIAAGSAGGSAEFDVDYILIKAAGLPNVTVAPNAFVQTPVAITNQPQSQVALECRPASISVEASGNPAPTFQWFKGAVPLSGATNATLTFSAIQRADEGSYTVIAQNLVSNITCAATSAVATVTVTADSVRPTLTRTRSLGLSQVQVSFSEPVSATANSTANYAITNASGVIPISSALLDGTQTNVTLTCASMVEGVAYTLVVNNVADACATNSVLPNSLATFTASFLATDFVGSPAVPGGVILTNGGVNVTGGGADIGGNSDQFQFAWQQRSGDFDLKVRVADLSLSDSWAEAGLMLRETLEQGSRFASAMATPSIAGCYFLSRTVTNGAATTSGAFPANYPYTWLRLRRAGSQFSGHAGYDGQTWTSLGTVTIAMPSTAYLGFAVASHSTNQSTVAAFRDFSAVTNISTNVLRATTEPLAQSSRRTSLVISEIMYHPLSRADGRKTEFVELFNTLTEPQDISGFRLSGEVDFTFPANTVLPGGAFVVVARVPADVQSVYGIANVFGPFSNTNSLSNKSGSIRLRHRTGAVLLEANYGSDSPYPISADGAGHSLVLAHPSFGEREPEAWGASDVVGGSPGRMEPVTFDPLRHVVINEVLANTDDPEKDFIELYNHSNVEVDISGAFLSDDPATNKFIIPASTMIPARGYFVFSETNLNFALSSHGEDVYLRNPSNTRVIDGVRFGPQEKGVSMGRSPDGASSFHRLSAKTAGLPNTSPRPSSIVINEIMYHPISEDNADEYVELYNRGTNTVDLYRWKLSGGVNFTIKSHTLIAPDGYVVIANSVTNLLAKHANLSSGNALGDYSGSLGNGGDSVALSMPEFELSTNASVVTTNVVDIVVNEVTYRDGGAWGTWSDGGGSSLELIDSRADGRLASNWADSDETAKAPWTVAAFTGILDTPVSASVVPDHLDMFLQGSGECLVDDIEVLDAGSANKVPNSTFATGITGWVAEGTQDQSSLEASGGFGGGQCLRVRAIDRGDNQVNRIRTTLSSTLTSGTQSTIRTKVRWLRGHPEFLLRIRGGWLELPVAMTVPQNLGTPGARNSRAITNAAPAIHSVAHYPVLPQTNDTVVVTARVSDPDGVALLQLKYRLDPSAAYSTVAMNDGGTNSDAVAGDGIFSGLIPAQSSGVMVAFYVQATDGAGAGATYPNNAPTRECLVRFGESQPSGSFPTYRIWMTQSTLSTWTSRSKLNNTPLNVVFVLNNARAIYNSQALYAGSPYISPGYSSPTTGRCGYTIAFPSDDPFLGGTDLVLDWPGGHGSEPTAIQEQMGYWVADQMNLPFSHRHFLHLHVNGATDLQRGSIWEAVMQPASEFVNEWSFDDEDGDFYKVDRSFEFNDSGGTVADPMPMLASYTTVNVQTGLTEKKRGRYRFNWMKRAYTSANDYTNIFALVDAVNGAAYEPYTSQTEGLVDIDEWMRLFAFEHVINNFDSYGHDIGKNMYAYKPQFGRWQLYAFDLDWLMLVSANSASYGVNAGLFNSADPVISRMYAHPPFRRALWRGYQDAVNGPLQNAMADPVMDAKYTALVQNGVTQSEGAPLQPPAALKTWWSGRRSFIASQLQAQAAPFAITTPLALTTNNNLVQISGTAPFGIETIQFNGVTYPITWTSQNNWTARVPLSFSGNVITVLGYDRNGQLVSGASNQVSVTVTAAFEPVLGNVFISEIMFHGAADGSEYIELFNAATNTTFDLSGWRVNGLDYQFPGGSTLGPRSFLVLAANRSIFSTTYGPSISVFGEFAGGLQQDGETISLVDTNGNFVDRVRYESSAPWPLTANGTGSSLQLIDAKQDNARVANWASGHIPAVYSPGVIVPAQTNGGWRFVSVTGNTPAGNPTNLIRLAVYLGEAGSALIDDVSLVAGTNAAIGTNYLTNGDFEAPLTNGTYTFTNGATAFTGWTFGTNYTNSILVGDIVHSGTGALKMIGTSIGQQLLPNLTRSINQVLTPPPATNSVHTLSFWFFSTNSATNLYARIVSTVGLVVAPTNINVVITPSNYVPPTVLSPATNSFSPGSSNRVAAILPAFQPLWINEVQPENISGLSDVYGEREPWIEIFNPSTNTVSLAGLYLSPSYTNLTNWAFPPGASIGATQFLVVFCDAQLLQTSNTEYHTTFRLPPISGSIALARMHNGQPQVLDYINYSGVHPDRSFGSVPDGQPFDRRELFYVTPRGTNDSRSAPLTVFINEWMASNLSALADPAGGDFDDWFELYNPTTNTVDLTDYYLTDTLTNKTKFRVTTNMAHTIPPLGYLLVWADEETGQNLSAGVPRSDMHVNFQLSKGGEAIGVFAADGTPVDSVSFAAQSDNVSAGRFPDGSASMLSMAGTASPRAANYLNGPSNTPPVLDPVGSKTIYAGQTLSFTATAHDDDLPAQLLRFSLVGAPAEAIISISTGQFTWIPTVAGTFPFLVRVTDTGTPAASDEEAITVEVLPAPSFTHSLRNGSNIELTWGAQPGTKYAVDHKFDLTEALWSPLTTNVANGTSLSFTSVVINASQEFFRVRVVE